MVVILIKCEGFRMDHDLSYLRREYLKGSISQDQLDTNPIHQFDLWFAQALEAEIADPSAMILATVDDVIGIRTVNLQSFDHRGFVFFTNYGSRKSCQIEKRPQAAVLFPWLTLERQVEIVGSVEKITKTESMSYFASRPREAQLAAWASRQSSKIASRSTFLERFSLLEKKFSGKDVPLPDYWGGGTVSLLNVLSFGKGESTGSMIVLFINLNMKNGR